MSKKILIIEDESLIAAQIESILLKLGYSVAGKAKNGDKALDLFATRNPDLVLLDINIKGSLNGIDLAKIIKAKHHFPYIFLTSYSDINTLNQVKETLPYGYIVKPFTDNDLRSAIELALFKFESEQQSHFPIKATLEQKLKVKLTPREYELYEHLVKGKSYKEIAEMSFISINTVKYTLKNLFIKLQVSSRHEATHLLIDL